jgi:F-type H+-transporting ATPase subunit a
MLSVQRRTYGRVSAFLLGWFVVLGTLQVNAQHNHPQEQTEVNAEEQHAASAESGQHTVDEHAEEGHTGSSQAGEEFNASEYILDHISDAHEWHLWTNKQGHHVSVYLPVILFSKQSGFHLFMSKKLSHGHNYRGFEMGHGTWVNEKGKEVNLEGKIVEVDAQGAIVEAGLPLDLSITKNVFMMGLSVIVLLVVFLSLARSYKKTGITEPKGLQGFLEPVIVFIEEDVAIPNLGEEKYARYMPYLLTIFFFILINNLMGLIPFFPFGANVTGNIALTFVLASFTFLITTFSGNREYWRHIFNTPGVPIWLSPIMIPVEIIGMFTKPFALMIRLFANITAGHIVVLSLISMIFIFKSVFMAVPSLVMVIFMDLIELLVAFLQAYIFTLLSALFIGLAMPEHHHE